jgi:hypothetical protein
MKRTFKQFLIESPVGDYKLLGDWDKGSSFTKKRDRTILQHPKAIEILKKKFNNNHHTFNLFFLNSKAGRNYTEVGKVDLDWVEANLGEDVAAEVEPTYQKDGNVNVIFTNNKGAEGRPMTAWIVAHRISHALGRYDFGRGLQKQFPSNKEAHDSIFNYFSEIMKEYGHTSYPSSERANSAEKSQYDRKKVRTNELILKHFFVKVCTFRSARENNVRDWFEILNELFAQYITTGKIKFNPPPDKFGTKGAFGSGTGEFHLRGDREYVVEQLDSLARTLEYYFDETLTDAGSAILVM